MPVPVRLQIVTVTGSYANQGVQSSSGMVGTVTFTAPELLDATDGTIIEATYVVCQLPSFSILLIATDNTGLVVAATGSVWLGYSISEALVGETPINYATIRIPHTPSPVSIATLL